MSEKGLEEPLGELQLTISTREPGGRSYARSQFHRGPLRVIRPHYLDDSGQVTYTVINPGGAYFGGDSYSLDFSVDAGASLLLTTQSATKVYRTPQGPAVQDMRLRIGPDATFEYLPDQLIVYREGSYRQHTVVEMDPTSHCAMAEIITPGWSPTGQQFTFDEIRMRTEIRLLGGDDRSVPFAVDQLRLIPGEGGLGLGGMEGYSHSGQLLIIDRGISDELYRGLAELVDASDTYSGITRAGVDVACDDGDPAPVCVSIRSLAHDTADIRNLQFAAVSLVRAELSGRGPVSLRKQ